MLRIAGVTFFIFTPAIFKIAAISMGHSVIGNQSLKKEPRPNRVAALCNIKLNLTA